MKQLQQHKIELLLVASLIVLLGFIFYYPGFLPGQTIIDGNLMQLYAPWKNQFSPDFFAARAGMRISDPAVMFYPWWFYIGQSLKAGKIPLWNPYSYCGSPLLANYQAGFFYPLNFLFCFCEYGMAQHFKLMIQFLICGLGLFLLLRFWNLGPGPAFFGSLIFLFNGFAVCWLQFPIMSLVSLLPVLILCLEALCQQWRPGSWVLLILILYFGFTAGHPETLIHILGITGLFLLVRLFHYGRRSLYCVPLFLLAILIAALSAGAQLIPFLEYLRDSYRLSLRAQTVEASYHFPLRFLILFYLPDFFGIQHARFVESSSYIGIVSLILATAAIWIRRKTNLILGVLVFSLLCLAIPFNIGGIQNLVQSIPLLKFSLNHRLLFGFNFGIAVLAALGLDGILRPTSYSQVLKRFYISRSQIVVLIVGLLHLLACLLLVQHFGEVGFLKKTFRVNVFHFQVLRFLGSWFSGLAVLSALAFVSRFRKRIMLLVVLSVIIFIELMSIYRSINVVFPSASLFPETKTLAFLRQNLSEDRFTARGSVVNPNLGMLYKLSDIRGYDGLGDKNYCTMFRFFTSQKARRPYLWHLAAYQHKNLLDLLSVRFLLTQSRLPDWHHPDRPFGHIVSEKNLGDLWLYERADYFPRVSVYRKLAQPKTEVDFAAYFRDGEFKTYAVQQSSLGSSYDNCWRREDKESLPGLDPENDLIQKFEEGHNSVRFRCSLSDSAFLVINNAFHPGWKAFLEGRELTVFRANLAFQGVEVPAGEHTLQLVFAPWSFRLGLFLSLLGLTSIVLFSSSLYRRSQ